jgi:hypothetical protein
MNADSEFGPPVRIGVDRRVSAAKKERTENAPPQPPADKGGIMRDCEICGNEIPDGARTCPYCDSPQRGGRRPSGPREEVRDINIEVGLPSVEEGLAKLNRELWRAIGDGVRVVRVIHGWGSKGTGGKLRVACRADLRRRMASRQVTSVVPGESYSPSTGIGKELMRRCPSLRGCVRTDAGNPGITFVGL